jgi:hypothetical protein
MVSMLLVGVAGLAFGGGMSASKHRAPRGLVALLYGTSALAALLAAATFEGIG